jgi:hypothetical protein
MDYPYLTRINRNQTDLKIKKLITKFRTKVLIGTNRLPLSLNKEAQGEGMKYLTKTLRKNYNL